MAEGKTAFVLAGGGSHGAVVVGMLREIVRAGVVPDFVVGASAGAINGAYFAGHPSVEGVARLEEIWCRLTTAQIFGPRWHSLVAVLRRRDYLFAAQRLRALLEAHLAFRDLAEARLPLHVVASDQLTGEEVVLSRGPAVTRSPPARRSPACFRQ